jgi:anti-sigma-K factor RskA
MSRPLTPLSEESSAQAAEYVLGTLSGEQRRDIERRVRDEPALRLAVQQWEADLLPLTALVEPVVPSSRLWRRIARSASAEAAPAPASLQNKLMWNSLGLWRALTAGSLIATALLTATLATRLAAPAAPQYMVVLAGPQDKTPGYVVQTSASRQVTLTPLTTAPVPSDKSLQFWTKANGWRGPVSLGLVKPGQTITIPLDALPNVQPDQLFEVTLEPVNGSPLNRPTGPVLFIGRAVKVM